MTTRKTLDRRRAALRSTVAVLREGVERTLADPAAATEQVAQEAGTPDQIALVRAQLDAVMPIFSRSLVPDRAVLEKWADFDARVGIVKRRPDVQAAFVTP